uniref:Uncharacterized protein n=1 Tax=Romanomermis culicivorax TaxID=13658 RepID=A0A915IQ03_ROMCU
MEADKSINLPTSNAKVDVESATADCGNAYQNVDVYLHASMLILIRQLSNLARNSENIISQIFDDSTKIERKWRKLTQRLQKIKQCADDLLNIDPKSIGNRNSSD